MRSKRRQRLPSLLDSGRKLPPPEASVAVTNTARVRRERRQQQLCTFSENLLSKLGVRLTLLFALHFSTMILDVSGYVWLALRSFRCGFLCAERRIRPAPPLTPSGIHGEIGQAPQPARPDGTPLAVGLTPVVRRRSLDLLLTDAILRYGRTQGRNVRRS